MVAVLVADRPQNLFAIVLHVGSRSCHLAKSTNISIAISKHPGPRLNGASPPNVGVVARVRG